MPARRARARRKEHTLTPELRVMAERLLELNAAHMNAITTDDDAFYDDGRHQELVDLLPIVHSALGISPWEDSRARLRAALAANEAR